ncbi:MAG: hypothetical protein AAF353_20380 [Pseudomonadota bacterium]
MRRGERAFGELPRPLIIGFVLLFAAQLLFHKQTVQSLDVDYRPLPSPLNASVYQGISMGSHGLIGHLEAIRLQLHDNQLGRHFSYNRMDYAVLVDWLETISDISPDNEYPLILASRIYSSTPEPEQLLRLIGFIESRFDQNPQLYWRRMTEAALIAKHQLNDLELALKLAEQVAIQPESIEMPHWARDFRFLLLAELNQLESAIAIIQALLETNSIQDPDELRFLNEKLSKYQQELFESQQNATQ